MSVPEPDIAPESEFRLLVEQVEDYAICLLDPEGRVVTWNAGAERLKGYTEEEIRGEHFSTFYPEEARERHVPERELAVAADEGRVEDYGWRVRKDGSRFWAHVVVTSLWEDGELRGYSKVTHDIGEHTRVNEILDRISDAVAAFDDELRFTYVNERVTALLDQHEAELVGSSLTDVFPEAESTRLYSELRRALATQRPISFDHDSELLDCWVDVRISPSDSGLSVYVQDISEQKEHHERLREEKALVEQILEVSPMAMAVFDATGTVVQSNARAEALLGEEGRPLLGRSLESTEGTLYGEQGEPLSLEEYPTREVLTEGKSVLGYKHGIELDDGTFRWLSTSFAPIRNEQGDVIRMVVAAEDITELKANEQLLQEQQTELDQMIAELERSNAELEQFAYVASHDLREPLRMVSSYLELLDRRYGETLPEDAMEFLHFALDGSRRLQRMINDLLAYSRVSREFDDVEAVDFEAVVDCAMENLTVSVDQTGAEITSDSLPTVEGNETLLVQLMQNLLGNAIKYSEETPTIHVSADRRDDEWLFAVTDEGVGLDPEEREKVFALFYGNSVDGAGIGLAICQKIVELHDGRIWVESTPGEGSTFYFTLPCE